MYLTHIMWIKSNNYLSSIECFVIRDFDIVRAKTEFRMCSERIAMKVSLLHGVNCDNWKYVHYCAV